MILSEWSVGRLVSLIAMVFFASVLFRFTETVQRIACNTFFQIAFVREANLDIQPCQFMCNDCEASLRHISACSI